LIQQVVHRIETDHHDRQDHNNNHHHDLRSKSQRSDDGNLISLNYIARDLADLMSVD